jgi:hypothetical protein
MSTPEELVQLVADAMAVTDVVLRFFELVDSKDWDHMDEVLTEETAVRRAPGTLTEGRSRVVAAMQNMIETDEIVTYHHVTSSTPVIHDDTAEVTVRVRAMHHGVGRRSGTFYESLAVQPTRLVRQQDGWRIQHRDWLIQVKLGSLDELFAPELAARADPRPA